VLSFDYTRSLGTTLSRFMTGLANGQVLGAIGSGGRVLVPPPEYDPVTHEPLTELVPVASTGQVVTWSWMEEPLEGQPLTTPFAWALVRLDGTDTPILHAVDAPHAQLRTGMRVRIRWAAERGQGIRDIACFEPDDGSSANSGDTADLTSGLATAEPAGAEQVTMVTTPIRLPYTHTASAQESSFLRALTEGRLLGGRCPVCQKVYVPPRGACPVDGVPTADEVELPDEGMVTTFCVVNVPFLGQRITPPYVSAYVLLDGADIAFQHLILECPADEVRMGMRVKAVWRPQDEWTPSLENITHFRPTGEPDAPYSVWAEHL
jgi:hypothetical protein